MSETKLLVFQNTVLKAEQWLHEIADELGWTDMKRAWTALRAVLHTLRDQLTVEESSDLSSQLPLLIRGLYFECWSPGKTTERIRRLDEFANVVNNHFNKLDVDYIEEPTAITRAVFAVIANHVSAGEIDDIVASLPKEIAELFPSA